MFSLLDFKQLPLDDVITLLRALRNACIQAVLAQTRPAIASILAAHEATLIPTKEQRSQALPLPTLLARTVRTPAELTAQKLRPVGDDSVTNFWQSRSGAAMAAALNMNGSDTEPGWRFPADFWQGLGLHAWTLPAERLSISQQLEDALRSWVFITEPMPVIQIAPQTLWLLLLLAPDDTATQPTNPHVAYMLKDIKGVASKRIAKGGWATLWDQWLILEAHQQWLQQERLPEAVLPVAQAIQQMPLFKQLGEAVRALPPQTFRRVPALMPALADQPTIQTPEWFSDWLHDGRQRLHETS